MAVPDAVIKDLLPLYFDGECSPETRALVEEYLRRHPELAEQWKPTSLGKLAAQSAAFTQPGLEVEALNAVKRTIRTRTMLAGIGIFFTMFSVAFTFSGNSMVWVWKEFPAGAAVSAVLGLVGWMGYGLTHKRLKATGV